MTTAAHYRLTSDEFLNINSKLSDAQLRVYLYYKTLDPFGDRKVEVCTKAIAEILAIKQRTVQRALNKLCELGLLIWEKAKSVVRRSQDRQSDRRIAQAIVGSPKRSEDRERQLELNLHNDSATSQSSSILFNLDQDLEEQEILNFENSENLDSEDNNENLEMTLEEAKAFLQAVLDQPIEDHPTTDAPQNQEVATVTNYDTTNEDLHLSSKTDEPQDFEEIVEEETDLQLSTPDKASVTDDGKTFRAAVEKFILKTLNKSFDSPARRAAYFAKFKKADWTKWETQYKASLAPTTKTRDVVAEDPWRLVGAIESAMKVKDFDYALYRLEALRAIAPELAEQTQQRLGITA